MAHDRTILLRAITFKVCFEGHKHTQQCMLVVTNGSDPSTQHADDKHGVRDVIVLKAQRLIGCQLRTSTIVR